MDNHSSQISSISSASPSLKNREIRRNDYIIPKEILKDKVKFFNLRDRFVNRLEEYATRLRVSKATIEITLVNILRRNPNYRFTFDEMLNLFLEKLNRNEPLATKSDLDIDTERAIPKPQINEKIISKPTEVDSFQRASAIIPKNNEIQSLEELKFSDKLNRLSYLENNPKVPEQIKSNRNFASWLLANPIALGSMISKPEFTNFFINAYSPRLMQNYSPIFFAQISELISQLLRLRQGKVWGEVGLEEEEALEDARNLAEIESDDHNHRIVTGVKNVINTIPIKSLKDFLMEAERFVEEEIALFYSVQKHLENEIMKQINKKTKNKK